MTDPLRAVFDTNVYVAAMLTKSAASPTRELLERLKAKTYVLLVCEAILDEVAEKLEGHGVEPERIVDLLTQLEAFAQPVSVPVEAVESVLKDPDDDIVLACAVLGRAGHIVTYDPHFDTLGGEYQGIKIVKALPFLWAVRGDTPPEPPEPTTDH